MAEAGIRLVYGGGRIGLMGALATGVLSHGGSVCGVIPDFLRDKELAHAEIQDLIVVDSMPLRKMRMFEQSDAFAVLPGGFGTLDETLEMLTWRQLGLHEKPVFLLDWQGFWQPLMGLAEHLAREGFLRPDHRTYMTRVESVEELVERFLDAVAAGRARHAGAAPDVA